MSSSALEDELAFAMRAIGLPTPEREYRFAPPRRWRADFAWPEQRVLVEVEGGVYSGGRHVRGRGYEKDAEKYSTASLAGWVVLRFTGRQVRSGEALSMIERAFRECERELEEAGQ